MSEMGCGMADPVTLGLMAGTTLLKLSGQRQQRKAEERAAQLESAQMDRQAQVERAMSQREALEERRQARLAQSALQARAGGGGPDIDRMSGDIAAEGEYRALSALYAGETGARSAEFGASQRRQQGRDASRAGRIAEMGTLLNFGSQMYGNFGGGGFSFGKYDGTNDRMFVNGNNAMDKFMRYGTGGD